MLTFHALECIQSRIAVNPRDRRNTKVNKTQEQRGNVAIPNGNLLMTPIGSKRRNTVDEYLRLYQRDAFILLVHHCTTLKETSWLRHKAFAINTTRRVTLWKQRNNEVTTHRRETPWQQTTSWKWTPRTKSENTKQHRLNNEDVPWTSAAIKLVAVVRDEWLHTSANLWPLPQIQSSSSVSFRKENISAGAESTLAAILHDIIGSFHPPGPVIAK